MKRSNIAFRILISGALILAAANRSGAGAAGQIIIFAGTSLAGYAGDNEPAGKAQLNNPYDSIP